MSASVTTGWSRRVQISVYGQACAERRTDRVDDQLDGVGSLGRVGEVAQGQGSVQFFRSEDRHGFLSKDDGLDGGSTPRSAAVTSGESAAAAHPVGTVVPAGAQKSPPVLRHAIHCTWRSGATGFFPALGRHSSGILPDSGPGAESGCNDGRMRWIDTLEAAAAEKLPEAVHRYFRQGSAGGISVGEAVAAWSAYRFRPRVLNDVSTVDLGRPCSVRRSTLPVLVAPSTMQRMADPDGEVAMATRRRRGELGARRLQQRRYDVRRPRRDRRAVVAADLRRAEPRDHRADAGRGGRGRRAGRRADRRHPGGRPEGGRRGDRLGAGPAGPAAGEPARRRLDRRRPGEGRRPEPRT